MRINQYTVVLDACVLVPMPVADTLLRLAEEPPLAAAVRCGANGIVSNNKKHFPVEALRPYEIECLTADEFLAHSITSSRTYSSAKLLSRRGTSVGLYTSYFPDTFRR